MKTLLFYFLIGYQNKIVFKSFRLIIPTLSYNITKSRLDDKESFYTN